MTTIGDTPVDRLLKLREVMKITSLGSSTIYRYMDAGTFPLARRFSPACVRWKESEIEAWIRDLPVATKNEQQITTSRRAGQMGGRLLKLTETVMDNEIETQRQQAIAEILKSEDGLDLEELQKRHGPGTFNCHEALHTASVALDLFSGHVMDHPSVLLNPEWYRLADEAQDAIFRLYQAIGAAHLPATDDHPTAG
jgi:predicted DNA-binding transcriptional regulator AlpA